eukprot:Hpha_TRINITY_DN15191_c1_g1::TRINITY_DN15191_c1_g1_i1::g.128336::m.128336
METERSAVEENAKVVVDKAVDFLWKKHKNDGPLEPDFLSRLKLYSNRPGWEFIRGPGSPGWTYFVEKIKPLMDEVADIAYPQRWSGSSIMAHFLRDEQWKDWPVAARSRAARKEKITLDPNRKLKLTSVMRTARAHLFKLLVRFGKVEFLRFSNETVGEQPEEEASTACRVQFSDSEGAAKVRKAIEAISAKQKSLEVDADRETALEPVTHSLLLQSLPGTPPQDRIGTFPPGEFGELFSLFSHGCAPSVTHERGSGPHDKIILTFSRRTDAAAALAVLQPDLAESFSIEAQCLREIEKAQILSTWRARGSEVIVFVSGGAKRGLEIDAPTTSEIPTCQGDFLRLVQPYQEREGEDHLQRIAGYTPDEFRSRFAKLQPGGQDMKLLRHILSKAQGGHFAQDVAEFSVTRMRPHVKVWSSNDDADAVAEELSADHIQGSFPRLNGYVQEEPSPPAPEPEATLAIPGPNSPGDEAEQVHGDNPPESVEPSDLDPKKKKRGAKAGAKAKRGRKDKPEEGGLDESALMNILSREQFAALQQSIVQEPAEPAVVPDYQPELPPLPPPMDGTGDSVLAAIAAASAEAAHKGTATSTTRARAAPKKGGGFRLFGAGAAAPEEKKKGAGEGKKR